MTIRILGDFAIIHSGYRDKKLTGDTGYGRYTDIYERRNGRWLCVAAHFMRFQTPAQDVTFMDFSVGKTAEIDYVPSSMDAVRAEGDFRNSG